MENRNKQKTLAPLPQLSGFIFRRFEGPGDYQGMVDIIMSNVDDPNSHVTSLEDITTDYAHISESVPVRDMVFTFHAEQPVAYCRSTCMWEESSNSWIYGWLLHVHHDWKRKGIEETLVGWLEDQAFLNHQALHPDAAGIHSVFAPEADQYRLDIIQNRGYTPTRYFENMKRDLMEIPDYPLPQGIEVRPAFPSQFR